MARLRVMHAALAVAALGACMTACACSPWGQDDVDRLREWQERQDERMLAQQRGLEERQQLRDSLMQERQYLHTDLQLHRERQHDERQTEQDKRLNDHQRLHDDLLQERQVVQSDSQRHRQDLQDQGLDEHQQLHDELTKDHDREIEDLRRQREQLSDQSRRDRERTDREHEQEQQRREREQQRREAEREHEQQRVERERELKYQRRRWRRAAENAENATSVAKTYQGAQLWRVKVEGDDVANLQGIEENGVAQVWYTNATVWDILVSAENQAHVGKLLADNKLSYAVVIQDLQRAISEENPALSEEELELTGRKGHRMTWQHYHRAADMHGWVDYLAKTYPDICETQVIGNSVEGRPLKVLRIKGKSGSPAMWVDGGIHAREWITSASVSYMLNELVENHDAHRAWLDNVDLYVLPLANPDGYEFSHMSDRMWRKNRRRGGGCDGIDLNRNFGYKWGGKGAGPQPCQEIYRGSGPFSEPETSAIQSFVLARKSSLKAYLSFHSYGQYVLYPWGYDRFVPPDHEDLKRVGNKMGSAMRATSGLSYTVGSSAALLYPASGGSDDWAKGVAGLKYAFTIELRDTGRHGFVLPSSHILSSGKEVLAAVKTLAQEGTLQQVGDQTKSRKAEEKELSASLRSQLEKEVRDEWRSQVDKEVTTERERAQARAQDLERQVRELEGIVRKRQLQHQSSSDMPCSSPARERQLQERADALQRELDGRRAVERQLQEQLQTAEQRRQVEAEQLQKQLTERRVAERQLQEQLRAAEEQLQERHTGASKVQAHLQTVKAKYEDLVSSLEQQLAASRQEVADLKDRGSHTLASSASSEAGESVTGESHEPFQAADQEQRGEARRPPGVGKRRPRRSQSAGESGPGTPSAETHKEIQVMPHQQNRPVQPAKPDAHLLATIRGLQHEMQAKDKELGKLNRELSDARATNRRLQQDRQRLLNEAGPPRPKAAPAVDPNPDLEAEIRGLRRDVHRLQEDLLSLHTKRVSDLTRLQAKHEEELEGIVCERVNERLSDRSCEGRVAELQGQLYTQQLVIAHLKEQLKHSEHHSEEVSLLKRERDQLDKSVVSLNKQLNRLKEAASPDTHRVAALQEQLMDLEARHEARERKLQGIVRDALKQCQSQESQAGNACSSGSSVSSGCSASVRLLHKNRDLCFYRAEMDRLLDALRELERTRHGSSP